MTLSIIAEVGSNWHDLNDCLQSIQIAKACGADAVKFQMFCWDELYGNQIKFSHAMPREWVPTLAEKAKGAGIEFMCTAFSPEGVDFLDPFVKRHKIASSENCYPQLLDKIASKGKPILLSCGGSSLSDIRLSLACLEDWDEAGTPRRKLDITLLYCVSAYPAFETNLFKMESLKTFAKPVGFSDHSTDVINAPLLAYKIFSATVIEKHFRLEHISGTPDAGHALLPSQFRLMVEHLRDTREIVFLAGEEKDARLKYNRRLIVTQDVSKGTRLKFGDNYGAYRSLKEDTKGLMPFLWPSVEGRALLWNLRTGDAIGPGTFEDVG